MGTTVQALANITDEGLFEELATAVLREAEPVRYAPLGHQGVNVVGKTVKSPLDGNCFIIYADPPHMIAVHHATHLPKDPQDLRSIDKVLRRKWLHDPSKVKPRKGTKPTAPAGDLIKTANTASEERVRTPDLVVTLALTTNVEPGQELIRDVHATGRSYGINIDIWSRSRLSHFLDNHPTGQWIRRSHLGIEQELLSFELLHELSQKSSEIQQKILGDDPAAWISRQVDTLLTDSLFRDLTFLVAGSGLGKSVACLRKLMAHLDSGGSGIVLSHETVASATTLEQAIFVELRQLHPTLNTLSSTPFSFCSPEKPFLVVIEDINRSNQTQALLEKLAGWSQASTQNDQQPPSSWRILCPLWPEKFASLPTQLRERIQPLVSIADGFTKSEGRDAVLLRACLTNRGMSPLDAEIIARTLGNDPLLIALHNQGKTPDANQTIEQFVEDALRDAEQAKQDYLAAEYRQAVQALGREMLARRKIDLSLNEVITWEKLRQHWNLLKHLVHQGKFIQAIGSSDNQQLVFRHDRVRDWILIDAAADLERQDLLEEEILSDPYFAEVMGAVLAREDSNESFLQRVVFSNPLALFHAFRIIGATTTRPNRREILQAINNWLDRPATHEPSNLHLRLEALAMLSETDAPEVPAIVNKFPDQTINGAMAKLRNGDVNGGIQFCIFVRPGVSAPWRDVLIEHAKLQHSKLLAAGLDNILRQTELHESIRVGALRLAGHLANSSLASSVEVAWNSDEKRLNYLDEYLWAFAQCCADDPVRFLEPVCDAWASLPDQPDKKGDLSPRNRVAAHNLRWAFRQCPPYAATDYFIKRGSQDDLKWPITNMIHGIDHPSAIYFIVNEFAAITRRIEGSNAVFLSQTEEVWRRAQESGRPISTESRELLLKLWQDKTNDNYVRYQAFLLWAETKYLKDLEILQNTKPSDELADIVLIQRLIRGDQEAISLMLKKVTKIDEDEKGFWWQYGRYLWSPKLSEALDELLDKRSTWAKYNWFESLSIDWIASDLISRMASNEAEQILIKHWNHLRFSSVFVQVALYVSTPSLLKLVHTTINECPEPRRMLEHISHSFGIMESNHPGIKCETQIHSLAPYLHLLSPFDICRLWEECNANGWFSVRRELLDDLISPIYPKLKWESDQAISDLENMIKEDRLVWLGDWIDSFLKKDVSWNEILSILQEWLKKQPSFDVLKVVAAAIRHKGSRKDLDVLRFYEGMSETETMQLIANTEFAVKRRSLG